MSLDEHVIEVRDLSRKFGAFTAVDAVNFDVRRSEIFGYLGANGAGKSTTIRMLCGLLAPTTGHATVAGKDIARDPVGVKRSIGYMSQRFSLYLDLTVQENLQFFAGAYGIGGKKQRVAVDAALERAQLQDSRNVITKSLPGGVRQRLALASALIHKPVILFLDEPTAGVSPDSRRDFWRMIRGLAREGTTLFVTTHHLDEAEYCDRIGLMVDGKLVALGTPPELKREHVAGAMFALADTDHRALRAALAGDARVLQIQPFGRRVHLRVDAALGTPVDIQSMLTGRGVAFGEIQRIEPTLEDVFLELVGGAS